MSIEAKLICRKLTDNSEWEAIIVSVNQIISVYPVRGIPVSSKILEIEVRNKGKIIFRGTLRRLIGRISKLSKNIEK